MHYHCWVDTWWGWVHNLVLIGFDRQTRIQKSLKFGLIWFDLGEAFSIFFQYRLHLYYTFIYMKAWMAGGETQEVFCSIRKQILAPRNCIKIDLNIFSCVLDPDVLCSWYITYLPTFNKRSGKVNGEKSFRKYLIYEKGFQFANLWHIPNTRANTLNQIQHRSLVFNIL